MLMEQMHNIFEYIQIYYEYIQIIWILQQVTYIWKIEERFYFKGKASF